jgi:hypothetical protein
MAVVMVALAHTLLVEIFLAVAVVLEDTLVMEAEAVVLMEILLEALAVVVAVEIVLLMFQVETQIVAVV